MDNNTIQVNTFFNKDLIISEVKFLDHHALLQEKVQRVIKLQDEGIRKALIELGWTPPQAENPLLKRRNSRKMEEAVKSLQEYWNT